MARTTTARLTRADWVRAATAALAERGLAGLAVEPLAAALGTTKGSFYWHFADRRALLVAVLETWEATTARIVTEVRGTVGGPDERLERLFGLVYADVGTAPDAALLSATSDPAVAATLARVTRARIAFVEELHREAGAGDAAPSRALEDYAAYLGLVALRRAAPGAVPEGDALATYLRGLRARAAARS